MPVADTRNAHRSKQESELKGEEEKEDEDFLSPLQQVS